MTTQTATTTAVRTLDIDRSHSEVAFQVRHLLSKVRGRFADFAGTIQFDESNPQSSRVDVTIQARSIDTAEGDRDNTFAAPISSRSTLSDADVHEHVGDAARDDTYDVVGDLTIHGVTRPVTLPASFLGAAQDPWGNTRFAFEAELKLNRKDFGLSWNAALETGGFLVGDEVKVTLSIQAK